MNILIFGESSTGKSTLASKINEYKDMDIYTGKDYLRLSKNKNESKEQFINMLQDQSNDIIFVATEKEEVEMVADSVIKILCQASLETKIKRFSVRFNGHMPKPVEDMMKRKDGMFNGFDYDLLIDGEEDINANVSIALDFINAKKS